MKITSRGFLADVGLPRIFIALVILVLVGPASALTQAQMSLDLVGSIPGPAEHVRVLGHHVYVSHHSTFSVWDVSDPSRPVQMGTIDLPQEIWGFRVRGDRAYLGANFFGVAILDISDPTDPSIMGNHETLGQTKIGAVYEDRVVLIDHMEGMVLVDVSDESEPAGAGSFFLDGYARDVVTSGRMAYATDSPTGLYVFDLSQPGPPEPVGVLHAPAAPRAIEVQHEEGEPSGILAGAGGGDLQIYDATDPANPVRAATVETPGRAARVAMLGPYVFVADAEAGVLVVDITVPSAPQLLTTVQTDAPARDIAVTAGHVFVVVGAGERQEGETEIQIFRRSS
ncbi:MAG: hypothetical protein CL484_11975 [Acidobacteria bacterium]|nr:hypothetical protein [Acidobacteriota bacterium]